MIWRCPRCRGGLLAGEDELRCAACAARYDCIGGIPDLRLPGASWIDLEEDRATARRLLRETAGFSVEELVRHIYQSRPDWDEVRVRLRTRQVLEAPARMRREVRGWLRPCLPETGCFLDVGCGPGTLLAAAAAEGWNGIGIDVSLVWLLVARRLIAEWGGEPVLAAALGEALPLEDDAVRGVVSLDVIEHVADQRRYLEEISRVTLPGGRVALSTPNRFSLAAEPHVFVWGVGWLPRPLQKSYVRWRSGKSYECTRLLSARETARLLRQHTGFQFQIRVAPVPPEEIAHFPAYRARLARLYNRLVPAAGFGGLLRTLGPFFRIVGTKSGPPLREGPARPRTRREARRREAGSRQQEEAPV